MFVSWIFLSKEILLEYFHFFNSSHLLSHPQYIQMLLIFCYSPNRCLRFWILFIQTIVNVSQCLSLGHILFLWFPFLTSNWGYRQKILVLLADGEIKTHTYIHTKKEEKQRHVVDFIRCDKKGKIISFMNYIQITQIISVKKNKCKISFKKCKKKT